MPELFRRLLSDADPSAPECVYRTDDEIKSGLRWAELDVDEAVKEDLFTLCQEFRDIFASAGNTGKLDTAQHSIDTEDVAPIKSRPYRLSPEKRTVVYDVISKMLEEAVIEPPSSPWSSRIVLMEKKNGEYRFCMDYCKLNAITKRRTGTRCRELTTSWKS